MNSILYVLFFIPSMIFFTIDSDKFWWLAYSTSETVQIDSARGLLWSARTAMPVGGFLFLIQGISEIFRALIFGIWGANFDHNASVNAQNKFYNA